MKLLFLSVLWSLSTVFGTGLTSLSNTCGIKSTTDDVVTGTRKVLNTASKDQNYAMLLKVMSLTWDVACYFDSIGKTYSGDLSKS